MNAAQIILEARRRAGLTQAQLAELVETTQSAVARWERGKVEPSFSTLRRVVAACGLDLTIAIRDHDPDQSTLLEANLTLSPEQRFDQLVKTLAFIEAGRSEVESRND